MNQLRDKAKTHTTNYFDTFIEVAEDSKAVVGTPPPSNERKKTIAALQYNLISKHPYKFTSDDILFLVHAERNNLTKAEYKQAKELFFSKGQPCFRTSPLTKTYGFGIHCNSNGKVALYGVETEQYQQFLRDDKIKKIKAIRTSKS